MSTLLRMLHDLWDVGVWLFILYVFYDLSLYMADKR